MTREGGVEREVQDWGVGVGVERKREELEEGEMGVGEGVLSSTWSV